MIMEGEVWHIVEAKRDDGLPTMFRIRELAPKKELTRIFVVEMPYPTTELSRLPNVDAHRRLAQFDEQWLRPACTALSWELVGSKTEDGSFFLYLYGASDPVALVDKLAPFDAALGFYDDNDPEWAEYATLRDLLDQAKAMPPLVELKPSVTQRVKRAKPKAKRRAKPKAKAKAKPKAKPKAKAKSNPNARKRRR